MISCLIDNNRNINSQKWLPLTISLSLTSFMERWLFTIYYYYTRDQSS